MTGKLLQAVGVLAILAALGAAFGGLMVLKDRVRIVVQSDEVEAAPDPIALLRDDLTILNERVGRLQQAIASNFEQLANGLEQSAEDRHEDVRALRTQVTALATRRVTAADLQAITERLDALQRSAETAAAMAATPTPVAAAPVAAEPEPEPVAQADPVPEPEAATPTTKKERRGFLSFSLPDTDRAFDEPQTYRLLAGLCRVGFDAKSTLHDFTGVTTDVSGSFRADFDDPEGLCRGAIVAKASTLVTGVEGRDDNMYEHLDSETHPEIRFEVERFTADQGGVDVKAKTAKGKVVGKMTIRGKTQPLTMPVTVSVDPQQRLVVEGQTKLKLPDYGVPVPSQLGVINMDEEVSIWIALRARARGGDNAGDEKEGQK